MEKYIDPNYLNENQGVLALLIFLCGLVIPFFVWLVRFVKNNAKLKISTINGPTFSCTFETGREFNNHQAHITAIVLYLNIKNIGKIPCTIDQIYIGYKWNIIPFSFNWFRYRFIGWFWLKNQVIALEDFQYKIGDKIKVYPFLTQINNLSPAVVENYLEVGKAVNGVVYFEQGESWGAMSPVEKKQRTKIKICILDSFGRKHKKIVNIPVFGFEEALEYNPSFGMTYQTLNRKNIE